MGRRLGHRTRIHAPVRGPVEPPPSFIGPYQLPTIEHARRLAGGYIHGTPEAREAVAQWIAATGDCVFHAASMVFGGPCWCADCAPNIRKLA